MYRPNPMSIVGLALFSLIATTTAQSSAKSLLGEIQSPVKTERMRATQQLVWHHKADCEALAMALDLLQPPSDMHLGPSARINALYYLANTSASGWSAALVQRGLETVQSLKRKHGRKPQTSELIGDLSFALEDFQTAVAASSQQHAANRGRIASQKDASVPEYGASHALLIGNASYQHWSNLPSIPGEIAAIKAALERRGFGVTVISNATGQQIKSAFNDFIQKYGYEPANRLLFFFSGHGETLASTTTASRKTGYIVGVDAPTAARDPIGFRRAAVSMGMIENYAKEIESAHALFLFDSCFSGSIFKTRSSSFPPPILSYTARPVRQFITAGSESELVPARSLFATYFIRALERDVADFTKDGYTTGTELGMFLHDQIAGNGQTPQWGKIRDPDLDEGDFVFLPITE